MKRMKKFIDIEKAWIGKCLFAEEHNLCTNRL